MDPEKHRLWSLWIDGFTQHLSETLPGGQLWDLVPYSRIETFRASVWEAIRDGRLPEPESFEALRPRSVLPLEARRLQEAGVKVGLLVGRAFSAAEWGCAQVADLRGADLADAGLSGVDLRRADLRGVDLSGAHLSGARLYGALLSGARPSNADLRDADLRYADLADADLSGADLADADLSGADLRGADLRGANLADADLSGADLSGADLRGANLRGADLCGANLRGAVLGGALLEGADLRDADLRGACWPYDQPWPADVRATGARVERFDAPVPRHFVTVSTGPGRCEDRWLAL